MEPNAKLTAKLSWAELGTRLQLAIYTVVQVLGLPFFLVYTNWRMHRHKTFRFAQGWQHRLAIVGDLQPTPVWIHAVSAGEVQAAANLMEAMLKRFPSIQFTLSCGSINGIAMAKQISEQFAHTNQRVQYCLMPADIPWFMQRLIRRIQPKLVIVVEHDVWPNMYHQIHQSGIPLFLVSFDIQGRSILKRSRWLQSLFFRALHCADCIFSQTETTTTFLKERGLDEQKLVTAGNLKFYQSNDCRSSSDMVASVKQDHRGGRVSLTPYQDQPQDRHQDRLERFYKQKPDFCWVAGSSYADEEPMLWQAHQALLRHIGTAQLIYAPREVQRFESSWQSLQTFCQANAMTCQRWSDVVIDAALLNGSKTHTEHPLVQIVLLDVIGVLKSVYQLADVAFVGGSLIAKGGHNILEPASLAKPILSGRHYFKQEVLYRPFIDNNAILICADQQQLNRNLQELALSTDNRRLYGDKALRTLQHNLADMQLILQRMVKYLERHPDV